jgi:hypothetical protein
MLVSTFELLVKAIAPAGSGPSPVARTIVQGYFLTIANTEDIPVRVQLRFTATTPRLNLVDTVTIRDVTGANIFGELVADPTNPNQFTYTLRIPANDTALVTLLPDLTVDTVAPIGEPDLLTSKSLEIRGYVEVSLLGAGSFDLLLTPEHRGTFLPTNLAAATPDFDQLVYALPTATGSSLFTLTGRVIKALKPEFEMPPVKQLENKPVFDTPGKPITDKLDKLPAETPEIPIPVGDMQRMLGVIAQRIDDLDARLANGQAFISAEERPRVGESN